MKKTLFYESHGELKYVGEWDDARECAHGAGTLYYFDCDGQKMYEGEWRQGKPHGRGTSYDEQGGIEYEGEWAKGHAEGYGRLFRECGTLEYKGEWKESKAHGHGTMYYAAGSQVNFEGEWQEGRCVGARGRAYRENGDLEYDHLPKRARRMPKCILCHTDLDAMEEVYVYAPCGHQGVCRDCKKSLPEQWETECPLCRRGVAFLMRLF